MKNYICLLALFGCLAVTGPVVAQTKAPSKSQPESSRGIVAEEFLKARPGKSGASAKRTTYRKTTAKSATSQTSLPAAGENVAQLGLTIWRLRPARFADTVRMVVQDGEEAVEWTPERVEAGTTLRIGDRIRLSFESPRAGYLYVIDREQYADGSFGEAELIFPTTRTRNGDNRVTAGRIIEIPGQEDRPNFFNMRPRRSNLIAESMIVIITPQPLAGVTIGEKALALTSEQVEAWVKSWDAQVERFELAGGAGKAWTRAEKEAGADATRQLTQEDPGPQTIYRVAVKPDQPILVKVGLRYARTTTRPASRF